MFKHSEIVTSASRGRAIAVGALIEIEDGEKFTRYPIAVTAGVWAEVIAWTPSEFFDEVTEDSRILNFLTALSATTRHFTKNPYQDFLVFRIDRTVDFASESFDLERPSTAVDLVVYKGPGDEGERVVTVMFPHEI